MQILEDKSEHRDARQNEGGEHQDALMPADLTKRKNWIANNEGEECMEFVCVENRNDAIQHAKETLDS